MKRQSLRMLLFSVSVPTLAACSDNNNTPPPPPPPPPVVVTPQEDTFGTVFGMAFREGENGTAIEPKDGDIVALSLTTEPSEIN